MNRLSIVIVAVTGVLASIGVTPASAAVSHDLTHASSFDSAVGLPVGTIHDPARYTVQVEGTAQQSDINDAAFIKVDIPLGHRLHAAFTIAPNASDGAGVIADLIDGEGFRSDYSTNPTFNDYSLPEGLHSGYLRSAPMGPENRSFERETYLRLDPRTATNTELFDVHLTLTAIPEVIDGGGVESIDRPPLRYPEDVEPVTAEQANEVFTGKISAGKPEKHDITVGWMEALDATAHVLTPAEGTLTFGLYNQVDEVMVLVGEVQLPADPEVSATFGQRSPLHYGHVTAANQTRNSGFLAGDLRLAVTYDGPADSEVEYEIFAAVRGDGVPSGTRPPSFDAEAAAQHHAELSPVDHDYYPAPGFEDTVGRESLWSQPLMWLSIALVGVAVVLAFIGLRRRR